MMCVDKSSRWAAFLVLFWRCIRISSIEHQINEEIRDKEVRVIGEDGAQLGIMPIKEAQNLSITKGLDLVKIAPQAVPPVCRIMDYGKFRFEQTKREKEARKNQKVVDIKELWLSIGIGDNDLNVKINHAKRFLQDGDKVKVGVRFRGREMAHTALGSELLDRFAAACTEFGTVEKAPKLDGRRMMCFIAPKTNK